jgi:hypothetical protein
VILGGSAITDLEKALLDPTMVCTDPSEVVADPDLTRDQQIEILRRGNTTPVSWRWRTRRPE